jgi:YlmC/YmxH family sporulation protein
LVKISDLKLREVVNVVDGQRLGPIKDVDIDLGEGRISALILPGTGRLLGVFGREQETVVPWNKIVKIGMDVILVEVPGYASPRREAPL